MVTNRLFKKLILIPVLLATLLTIPTEQTLAAEKSQLIYKVKTSDKVIALTFDDGSDGEHLMDILQILKDNDVKATFFLTGSAAKAHPKLLKSIIENGNAIGNHSYTHPEFTKLSTTEMKKELSKTETVIKDITDVTTKPLFRPPYGDYNNTVLQTVGAVGYSETIYWTIDTLDWKGYSAAKLTKTVLSKATPGSIVLMHAGGGAKYTPAALPGIIKGLKDKGYQFVTIPELLSYLPSKDDTKVVTQGNNTNPKPDAGTNTHEYIVKKGDTLSRIGRMYGVTVEQLADVNHIADVNLIYTNQVLIIPS